MRSFCRGAFVDIKQMFYYTYALYNKTNDKFYIGYTNDLKRRLTEHLRGKTSSITKIEGLKLVYYEACLSKKDAQKRELQLKTGFGRGYLRKRLDSSLRSRGAVG